MAKKTKQPVTNEDYLKLMFKNNHPIQNAILRERIVTIAEMSLQDIENDPKAWENPFIHVDSYKRTFEQWIRDLNLEG